MEKPMFPEVSFAEWQSAAEMSLKGKPLSTLQTKTLEEIELKLLYTKDDYQEEQSLPGEKPFTRGFHRISSFPETNAVIGTDPISSGAAEGVFPTEELLQETCKGGFLTINTVPYHLAGASAVQELAISLSEAVFFMNIAEDKSTAASTYIIHFAAGADFFTEIAKIRAFRTLWSTMMDVYGLKETAKPKISVETSERNLSALDPHINILRTASAAFSAVLGNIDYLTVRPFDEVTGKTTELAERTARSIPLLLKHEALLDKVADPAGGSYYIEALTKEIGRLAWDLFAEIEESGGIKQALLSGKIQQQIAAVQSKRQLDAAVRKQQLIGINVYVNPDAEFSMEKQAKDEKKINEGTIPPLNQNRLAEPFEKLRRTSLRLLQTKQSVQAGLICLGGLAANKPRADYVAGMLAAGGIEAVRSDSCMTTKEAIQFVKEHPFPYYCLCGTDAAYEAFGQPLVHELKKWLNGAVLDVAGKWTAEGVHGTVAEGDDLVQKLSYLLSLYEGGSKKCH